MCETNWMSGTNGERTNFQPICETLAIDGVFVINLDLAKVYYSVSINEKLG